MFHISFVNNYNEAQKKKGKERVKKNIMIDPQHHTLSVKLQHANVEKKNEEFIPSVTLIKKVQLQHNQSRVYLVSTR